jgi:hypothetical protein
MIALMMTSTMIAICIQIQKGFKTVDRLAVRTAVHDDANRQ